MALQRLLLNNSLRETIAFPLSSNLANGLNSRISLWRKDKQNELFRYPIPSLNETTDNFLRFARSLQKEDEYRETVSIVRELHLNPEARALQRHLEERSKTLYNWLTPWWVDCAYLEVRTPLPIWTSPGVTFPNHGYKGSDGQLEYSSKIIQALLEFHHLIINDKLEDDTMKVVAFVPKNQGYNKMLLGKEQVVPVESTVSLDMSQYRNLFGTMRIPRNKKDEVSYGKNRAKWSRHIIITKNGHSFYCPVYDEEGNILGIEQLKLQLAKINDFATELNENPINIVSSDDRDFWAKTYQRLEENNPKEIRLMKNSLFVLSLDNSFALSGNQSIEDQNMEMALHGCGPEKNAINRWFDKTLQFYVNTNCDAGMTYEHTPAEGPPLARLLDFVCDQLCKNSFTSKTNCSFEEPKELNFNITEEDRRAIVRSKAKFDLLSKNLEVKVYSFRHFGKNIPKSAKLSPDSFIQLSMQVAFHRIHGTLPPTYETGSLRRFIDGRTETIRLPTVESANFVKNFNNREPSQNNRQDLVGLLEKAINSHKEYSRLAMSGKGMDRHLLGLKMASRENRIKLPKIFESKAYEKMTHFRLSTSQVPTKHILPMGFGPSAPDCYGVCYNPQEDKIFFTITTFNECRETNAGRFVSELETSLLDMECLLVDAGKLGRRSKL